MFATGRRKHCDLSVQSGEHFITLFEKGARAFLLHAQALKLREEFLRLSRLAHREADLCALLFKRAQLRTVGLVLILKIIFERLILADVQAAFGENRAETVF